MDGNMMWMNRKQQVVRGRAASTYESWEERAFAEDAARGVGGFIWPPRSYTCSFCRREFKSAQALGGHMNVHRRDRARLKQALSPRSTETIRHAQTTTFEDSPNAVGDHHMRNEEDKEHVSTKLCMGLSLDEVGNDKCKRLKSGKFILAEQCLVVQSSSLLHHGGLVQRQMCLMEELDLELKLGV